VLSGSGLDRGHVANSLELRRLTWVVVDQAGKSKLVDYSVGSYCGMNIMGTESLVMLTTFVRLDSPILEFVPTLKC